MAVDTRTFRNDPEAGIREIFHYDDVTDKATIETIQDVTGLVEANRAEFNMHDERAAWVGTWHRVGSIPMSLFARWQQEGVIDFNGEMDLNALRKRLNDGDYRAFRTRPGRI